MLEHRDQGGAEPAMFVPSLESLFEKKHNEHAQGIQGRAQQDIQQRRLRPDPRSQRDMLQHEHDLSEDQCADQRQ